MDRHRMDQESGPNHVRAVASSPDLVVFSCWNTVGRLRRYGKPLFGIGPRDLAGRHLSILLFWRYEDYCHPGFLIHYVLSRLLGSLGSVLSERKTTDPATEADTHPE